MANRRMFAITIIDSDVFLGMSEKAQLLYFHLSMHADDEGFINKTKLLMRIINAKDEHLDELINCKFVMQFESGVIVIKHWRINNIIREDRLIKTNYQKEFEQLIIKENGAYSYLVKPPTQLDNQATTKCQPDDNQNEIKPSEEKTKFEQFRKFYPGTKRGLDTEYKCFCKHKDHNNVIDLLLPAIEREEEARRSNIQFGRFYPQPKNLQTWLNKRCWETEIQETLQLDNQIGETKEEVLQRIKSEHPNVHIGHLQEAIKLDNIQIKDLNHFYKICSAYAEQERCKIMDFGGAY